jgi:hypothetical protein
MIGTKVWVEENAENHPKSQATGNLLFIAPERK